MLAIKFGENQTNRSEVIQITVNSKKVNGGHLEFLNLRILGAAASMEFTLRMHVACQI